MTPPVTQGNPQGAYTGTTSSGETFEAIILQDDTFYGLYGKTSGNTFNVAGMLTGKGSYSNGTYTASVTDYYYTGATYTGSVKATYVVGSSISGTVSESGNPNTTFSGTPIAASQYAYASPAPLSNITGTWTGFLFGDVASVVTIASNGAFTGSSQGCNFSGTVTPDSSGDNFFDFSITYGASPCLLPNQTQSGIAVDYLLPDGVTRQLLAAVSSASTGNVFIANRAGSTTSPGNINFVQSSSFTSQSTVSSSPSSTYTATFTNPVANGDLVAVAFWWNFAPGAGIVSVTDSAGNTYYPVIQTSSADSNDWAAWIYEASNVSGGSNLSITVTVSYANADQFSMAILEYSGVHNIDGTSTSGGTSGMTISSGSAATNHANELILGVAVADVNLAAGSGFNSRFSSPYFCVEDNIVSTQGTYAATFVPLDTVQDEGWDAAMGTFY